MKFLLTAINAKYIHSNPGVYSLKMFAESQGAAESVRGDQNRFEDGLPCMPETEAPTSSAAAGLTAAAKEKRRRCAEGYGHSLLGSDLLYHRNAGDGSRGDE